eukprot:PITA_03063
MFWANAVLCVLYLYNRCPSNAIRNKTPYEVWYGHIPSIKHLRVFGSTCYALISKVHRNKLGARSRKCIFLGYSNTSKSYLLYDEVNKKFVVSRYVIFLESSKADNVVERKLDHLDRFANAKSFQEFDNHILHLKGGIPILDQPVESSSEALSPPHETPTTDTTLSDVFNRIGRLNFDSDFEPTSFKEVTSQDEWKEAMKKEHDALINNGTWKMVDPPLGTKPIGCKWVYKNKCKTDGSLDKHKSRLVEKCFAQKEGVNYDETFSPIAKYATIRTLFSPAAQNGWKVHQMDVKTTFLNGNLKENVFMS